MLQQWRGVAGRGRGARGDFSQIDAAAHLGVSKRTYENWEQGRREPQGLARAVVYERIRSKPSTSDKRRSALRSRVIKRTKGTPPASGTGRKKSNRAEPSRKQKVNR